MDEVVVQSSQPSSKENVIPSENRARLDAILQVKLENVFHKQTSMVSMHEIAKIAFEYSPEDLAFAVSHLPPSARPVLYDSLPSREAKISFVVHTDTDTRLAIFRYMSDQEMKKLFDKMPTEEAVSVLEDMSERRFRRVMELIEPKKACKIRELKKHNRNSAGRLMSQEFFYFPMDMTVGEVASYIRDYPRIDFTRGIFIYNSDRELLGSVPGRNLIINPPDLPLKQVMRPVGHKVSPEATREEVVDIVERYKLSSLPVVDENNDLIGVITHEDVVETMEDLADETIAKMAGTAEKVSISQPILIRFLARSPWLLVTLLIGLVNVGIMSSFQKQEKFLTIILFFVPLITGMSGNVGIQCSTVLVRSMAVGFLSPGNRGDAITKELLIGLCTGVVFGIGIGAIVYTIQSVFPFSPGISPTKLGVIVGTGLFGACFTGTCLGSVSPLLFTKFGVDPAIASGPIVTAVNDFLSMTMYLFIAWSLGSVFF
jgi:magnesium transporter